MKHISVALGDRSYPIYIGANTWQPELLAPAIKGNRVLVISNETIAPLYLDKLVSALTSVEVDTLILPDGEKYKSMTVLSDIYDHLMQNNHDRGTTLIALGGGVIGDITGFAAATYQRGVNFIQVPTTLLSQVDSSVGGKTAVNHPKGKNMIGAFYQPQAVFIDTTSLSTLPEREFAAGMAEVIKYGFIRDESFLQWLEDNILALNGREVEALTYAIKISCQTKADVVAADETEQNLRAILNLGHTFGHAIEAFQEYQGLLHGEAVGVGMIMAARMSELMGHLTADDVSRVIRLIDQANLPTSVPVECNAADLRRLMSHDKKVRDGQLKLVLLNQLGDAIVTSQYDSAVLDQVLKEFCSG